MQLTENLSDIMHTSFESELKNPTDAWQDNKVLGDSFKLHCLSRFVARLTWLLKIYPQYG